MIRNENYPKLVQAMHLMDEGRSYTYLVKHMRLRWDTLHLARRRYLEGGELALLRPSYVPRLDATTKEKILLEIEEKGLSLYQASLTYGVSHPTLSKWRKAYNARGIAGLSRPDYMKKKRQRTEAELDELEILRKRNEYLEAENALLKKVKALVEEREARLRAIGRKPSKD